MTCLPPVAFSIMWYIFLQCLIPLVSLPPLSLHAMTLSWFPTVPLSVSLFPVVSLAQLSLSGLPYSIATIALPFKPTFYLMDLKKNFLMKPLSVSSWPVSYLSPCVSPLDNGSTQLVCVEGGGNWSWHPPPPHSHLPPPSHLVTPLHPHSPYGSVLGCSDFHNLMRLTIKGKALPLLLKFHIYLSTNSKPAQYPKLSQCMPNPEKQYSLVPKNLLSF